MPTLIPTAGSTGRPEPVLDAAKLAAAVSGTVLTVGAGLVLVGWVTADQVQNWAVIAGGIVTSIGALLAVAMPIITALGARAQVTPLADPRGMRGDALPITPGYPTVAVPDAAPREFVDELRDLEQVDATRPIGPTAELPAVGSWHPPTPAALAHEPTPIGSEAEAASISLTAPSTTD